MKHSNRHLIWMIIGCILPLLLITFLAPLTGFRQGGSLLIFIVAMFVCHLFMMRGHESNHQDESDEHHHHSQSS